MLRSSAKLWLLAAILAAGPWLAQANSNDDCPSAFGNQNRLPETLALAGDGDAQAQYCLGYYYYSSWLGSGGDDSIYEIAQEWFLRAAEQDHPAAQYRVGRRLEADDPEAAAQWYLKSALQGDPQGQVSIGIMYMDGLGVPQDIPRGYAWIRISEKTRGKPFILRAMTSYKSSCGSP